MNVASLELCKELFELSGWGNYAGDEPQNGWHDIDGYLECSPRSDFEIGREKPREPHHIFQLIAPAYDLGYMLRKLPQDEANSFPHHFRPHLEQERKGQWSAYLECDTAYEGGEHKGFSMADTPEDAVARLAIDLFKQGVLAPPSKEEPKA